MNRRKMKQLYGLLAVLVVICIVTFAVSRVEKHQEKIKNSDEVILEVPTEEVQSLSWKYGSESLAFHKDGNWYYDDDENFPVDEDKISELLELFDEFGVSFVIEDVEDYGQYGLDDPECTIKLATADTEYEVKLGDYSVMDSERYVSIGDGNVYLVKNDPMDIYEVTISDMIDHDDFPSFNDVTEIQFAGTENYQVDYEEDSSSTYCKDDVYFAKQDDADAPLDTSRVKSYLRTISNLDPTDYVTYNAEDKDLKTYGMDNPKLTVTVQYTPEKEEEDEYDGTFVLNIGRVSEKEDADGYVRVGESKIIYRISSDDYDKLTDVSYDSLRHLEVLSADFDDIHQIDVTLDGTDYTITSKGKSGDRTYSYQGEELEIDDLKNALEALSADSFTDEQPTEKEEISLTVYLDNDNYPEVQIQLYRYDGSSCLAVVDGKPVSLVKRSDVVALIEAINAIVL